MRELSKSLLIVGAIGLVVLVGVLAGRLGSSGPGAGRQLPVESASPPAPEVANRPAASSERAQSHPSPNVIAEPSPATVSAAPPNLITEWEEQLDTILVSEADARAKAQQMLDLFPRLPEAGQVAAAEHLSNLLPDEAYAPMGKLLADSKLPEAVLDVLLADVLNRPNALKLPLLLQVARDPQHPMAGEAKDFLAVYLDADYGKDWDKWQSKMETWLKENPD